MGHGAGPNQTHKLTFTPGSFLISNAHCSRSNQLLMDKIKSLVEYSVSFENAARYESQMRLPLHVDFNSLHASILLICQPLPAFLMLFTKYHGSQNILFA